MTDLTTTDVHAVLQRLMERARDYGHALDCDLVTMGDMPAGEYPLPPCTCSLAADLAAGAALVRQWEAADSDLISRSALRAQAERRYENQNNVCAGVLALIGAAPAVADPNQRAAARWLAVREALEVGRDFSLHPPGWTLGTKYQHSLTTEIHTPDEYADALLKMQSEPPSEPTDA